MHQLIQIIGALLILAGFVLAQFRLLDPQSLWYLVVNLVGSAILTVDAWREAHRDVAGPPAARARITPIPMPYPTRV